MSNAVETERPTVSVVIPTYNQPAYLEAAVNSVFEQTFADFEVIVVDDGSTDDTPAKLGELSGRYGARLRVIRQSNGGIGDARNRGLSAARGQYIALLDHDDTWHPRKLEVQVRFMEARPECAGCSVPWSLSSNPGECSYDLGIRGPDGIVARPLLRLSRNQFFVISSALLLRRRSAVGLRYATVRRCIEDVPFQIRLFSRGAFGIAGDEVLMTYRVHDTNYSALSDFSYKGIRLLRSLSRSGYFEELPDAERRDLEEYLSMIGRQAAISQLLVNRRRRALQLYWREFPKQVSTRGLRFIAVLPVLLCLPQRVLRWRWRSARVR
jgi:glycosyltransferase involved in cell wall biosynthesis